VAIVNESFVRSHLGSTPVPVGQRIRVGDEGPWITVVGVAADTRHYGLDRDSRPAVYEPARQLPSRLGSHVAVVTDLTALDLIPALRAATREVDASLPIYDVQLLADRIDDGLVARRSSSWLFAIFSGVALLLATAGLYGLISYGVGQRRRELGIRLALGAQRGALQRQVIAQGLVIVGIGLVLGVGAGWLLSRLASTVLVQPAAAAPVVFAGVIGLVLTVTVLANWAPARRAARVDMMSLLRRE
jgi:putative ABC transport system permease protein